MPTEENFGNDDESFLIGEFSPDGKWCVVFEDNGETGYMYIHTVNENGEQGEIFDHLWIYNRIMPPIRACKEVYILWNDDSTKAGLIVDQECWGIFDLKSKRKLNAPRKENQILEISFEIWEKGIDEKNGEKMKISLITGRENHDSVFEPEVSAADAFLPDTIKITEKNREKIKDYYFKNPFVSSNFFPDIKDLRRISIAPTNPYWAPILPANIDLNQLKDARKRAYKAIEGKEYVIWQRKPGCGYYDQFGAYIDSDVIIFNSRKYLSEMAIGRKPATEIEIIDEADEFLDSFSNSLEINLTRLGNSLRILGSIEGAGSVDKISKIIENEEKNKRALGIIEDEIFELEDSKLNEMIRILLSDKELESEIRIDDTNYTNSVLDELKFFSEDFKDVYLTYKLEEDNLFATLISTNLSKKFQEIVQKNKAVVLMSGTLHSKPVLKKIFGINDFEVVDAETLAHQNIEIIMTGKEFDCSYQNLRSEANRKKYLKALGLVLEKSKKPSLIHVNAFFDLPNEAEIGEVDVFDLMTGRQLRDIQKGDKAGLQISLFKKGVNDVLFSTKCSRGVDFPGEMCNTVIFTKYPNPNVRDIFWKVLQKTHPHEYWDFYKDKARREFLQRIYRAVRSKEDHVFVMSPDIRVINAVRELQRGMR